MGTDEIIKMFIEKSRLNDRFKSDEKMCLCCFSKNPNWIVYLEDCLEDVGISLEKFCQVRISGAHSRLDFLFFIHRGRLCVNYAYPYEVKEFKLKPECVSVRDIRMILDALAS